MQDWDAVQSSTNSATENCGLVMRQGRALLRRRTNRYRSLRGLWANPACNPMVEIQRYTCRITGKDGKDATLRDLPEDIVNFKIDFILDAIGLGHEDIELDVEHFLSQPSLFCCKLGDIDADRGRVQKEIRSSRIEWSSIIRGAIGRFLTDVLSYRYRAEDNTLVSSNRAIDCNQSESRSKAESN